MKENLEELQQLIGYKFMDSSLLAVAMTHTSYAKGEGHAKEHNQRLEYLGDAVLELCVSEFLFKNYKNMTEGNMTRARAMSVCEDSLNAVALQIGLGECIFLSKGEEKSGGRSKPSILADTFEALVGAIFIDGGIDAAKQFIIKYLKATIQKAALGKGVTDYKTLLQEKVQALNKGALTYKIIQTKGPEHKKQFSAQVVCEGQVLGQGTGNSKKEAEQRAACQALGKY